MKKILQFKRVIPFYFFARHLRHILKPKEREYTYIYRNLNRWNMFLDVGANLGYYSYLFSLKGAVVHSVEPNPYLAEFLCYKLGRKTLVHNVALADKEGELELFIPRWELTSGRSSLDEVNTRRYSQDVVAESVSCKRLDSIVQHGRGDRVFVKIDVEGHEYQVLAGADKLIEGEGAVDFMVEIETRFNSRWLDVFERFAAASYRCFFYDGVKINELDIASIKIEKDIDVYLIDQGNERINNFFFSKQDMPL